jgi:hypothetical protein
LDFPLRLTKPIYMETKTFPAAPIPLAPTPPPPLQGAVPGTRIREGPICEKYFFLQE